MEFAYLDESGDLGAKGSRFLILTLVCTSKKKELDQVIVNLKKKLLNFKKGKKWLGRTGGEIKFYGFPEKKLLLKALSELSKIDMNIYYFYFEKNQKRIFEEEKAVILGHLFWHMLKISEKKYPEKIIADLNFFNKKKINWFHLTKYKLNSIIIKDKKGKHKGIDGSEYSFKEIPKEEYKILKKDPNNIVIKIEHQNSRLFHELQAVDLICGTIFQLFEHQKPEYYLELSKNKITIIGAGLKK